MAAPAVRIITVATDTAAILLLLNQLRSAFIIVPPLVVEGGPSGPAARACLEPRGRRVSWMPCASFTGLDTGHVHPDTQGGNSFTCRKKEGTARARRAGGRVAGGVSRPEEIG